MADQENLATSFKEAQTKLVVQTADLPLGTLAGMVESGAIDLDPGFQRRQRWDVHKQSALIESFLLNVPVPPVYLAEEETGTYTAIDGKQRLRAIAEFMNGRLALKGLTRLTSAESVRFANLPAEIANALRLRPFIRVVTLLKQTDPQLKYEVFLRLNTGGEILNAQEIRNVAFRGSLNDAIYELARAPFFQKQLKITSPNSGAYRIMADAEFVLRFLTLNESWEDFGGSLVSAMNTYMADYQRAKPAKIASLKESFLTALSRCEQLWGKHAFKRPEGLAWRDQLLAGMYDAQMLSVAALTASQFDSASQSTTIARRTRELFHDEDFETAVRTGTNTPARIRYRVLKVKEMLLA